MKFQVPAYVVYFIIDKCMYMCMTIAVRNLGLKSMLFGF